ncbi:MAG: flavin reductase family protein [Dehalococcoidia bacterium]|nr:flavin reductase family protein [Dehalococcoidia bacterium]MDZ4245710.1 flavin reductase family protein [Dehalococcoidia bacterium]
MLKSYPIGKSTVELPCSVVAISAKSGAQQGAMTASAMYVSQVPALILVSIAKSLATYELIEKSKAFAINILSENQIALAKKLASVHGKGVDKLKELKVATSAASTVKAPLIDGCFGYIECKVKGSFSDVEGDHAIYIGEAVSFKLDKSLKPLVWLENKYFKVGSECKLKV